MTDGAVGTLRHSPLDDLHRALNARMVPFAGWEMPIQFKGIVEEHQAVRQHAGAFDVSHMGRLFVTGPDAPRLLRRAVTYAVDHLQEGRGHYTLLCNAAGGILDDPYVYRLDAQRYLFIGNASNADRDREQVASLVEDGMDVELLDRQLSTVMFAVQGREAVGIAASVLGQQVVDGIAMRRCAELPFAGQKLFVSRTGYTGEDGFEFVANVDAGRHLWQRFLAEGVQPCGLGARDTLRLESALALYGNDIDETTNPFEAGLDWVVSLDDEGDFVGRDALLKVKAAGIRRRLVCLKAVDRGVIRHDCPVLQRGKAVGRVTSGGHSPTLGISIAMAYLPLELTAEGTEVEVDVRGRALRAVVVPRPFYRRPKGA